jgi:hypothetical protein
MPDPVLDPGSGHAGPAPIGHNRPPPVVVDQTKARELADVASAWLDREKLADEAEAEKVNDIITAARRLWKELDEQRTAAASPYRDAIRAIDDAYAAVLAPIAKIGERLKPLRQAWIDKKAAELAAARAERAARARLEAERAQAELDAARARNDVVGEAEAERAAAAAAKAEKAAAREPKVQVGSYSGGGRTAALRTVKEAEIVNIRQAFMAVQDDPAVVQAIQAALNRKIRKGWPDDATIPGVVIHKRKVAA